MEEGEGTDNTKVLNGEIDYIAKLKKVNCDFSALDRLHRPPVLKWGTSKSNPLTKVDPFETNQVRIYSVTWNLAGKTPT